MKKKGRPQKRHGDPQPEMRAGSLAAEIMEIGRRCAALPDLDRQSPEEILDYDENGLPG